MTGERQALAEVYLEQTEMAAALEVELVVEVLMAAALMDD